MAGFDNRGSGMSEIVPRDARSSDEILTFETAGRHFALPVTDVREIVRAVAVTPLPGAPSVVEGIIDVRGELVPVLDLRRRLGLPKKAVAPSDHFIVTVAGGRTLILWVERAHSLVPMPAEGIESKPDLTPGAEYVAGVVKLPNGLVLIQDVLRFLSPTEELDLGESIRQFRTS